MYRLQEEAEMKKYVERQRFKGYCSLLYS